MPVPAPVALVALKVIGGFVVPAVVGVPEMTPVAVLTDSPEGKFVALKLVGVFVPVMV